ncbi:MAG: hypothetical protein QM756_09490 [Polyangiaceae bacterium]
MLRDGKLFHLVNWLDWENWEMSDTSKIVVIDTAQDKVVDVLDAPCPNLDVASLAPDGSVYFSNWVYSPGATLVHGAAKACVVRILPGSTTLDPDFKLTYADITGGHEGAAFMSLGSGKALFSAFYDDNQAFDASKDDISAWVFGANWKFQMYDEATGSATPFDAVGWHAGGFAPAHVDGNVYVLVPGNGYKSTVAWKLDGDGNAERSIELAGWSTRLFQLH